MSIDYMGNWATDLVSWEAEVEERENQVYGEDGIEPVKIGVTVDGHDIFKRRKFKIRLTFFRYFYRLRVEVSKSRLIVGDSAPEQGGADCGDMAPSVSVNVGHDLGVKYFVSGEEMQIVRSEVNLWRHTKKLTGLSPWKRVPSSWKMDHPNVSEKEWGDFVGEEWSSSGSGS